MNESFLPDLDTLGTTTATQVTAAATGATVTVKGNFLKIGVGLDAVYIKFGKADSAAVTAGTGMRLAANSDHILSVPTGCNSLLYIREAGDATINIQSGLSGT